MGSVATTQGSVNSVERFGVISWCVKLRHCKHNKNNEYQGTKGNGV